MLKYVQENMKILFIASLLVKAGDWKLNDVNAHLYAKSFQSCLTLCNPWTVAHQSPLSMGFSRQECWSGLLCPPTGDLPSPGVKPVSLMSSALADRFFPTNTTWEAQ